MNVPEKIDYHCRQAIENRFNEQRSRAIRDFGRVVMGAGASVLFYANFISEAPTSGKVFEVTMGSLITVSGAFANRKGMADSSESCVQASTHEIAAGILMAQLPTPVDASREQSA